MSIFTTNSYSETITACEGYSFETGGNYDAMMESYADDYAIIEAMHAFDMAELAVMKESGGTETYSPVMEASLKEIWDKIKAAFKKFVQRILAFFKSLMTFINSLVLSGSEFAKKYKAQLLKVKLTGFEYEMYDYKIETDIKKSNTKTKEQIKKVEDRMVEVAKTEITKADTNTKFAMKEKETDNEHEKTLKELRKELSGSESEDAFAENVFKKLRNGGEKKMIKVGAIGPYLTALEKSGDLLTLAKEAETQMKSTYDKMNTAIDKAAAEVEKNSADGKYASAGAKKAALIRKELATNNAVSNLHTRYLNAWTTAVRERTSAYKSLCVKALSYKAK